MGPIKEPKDIDSFIKSEPWTDKELADFRKLMKNLKEKNRKRRRSLRKTHYARFIDVDPEQALEKTNRKFIFRFMQMEKLAAQKGKMLNKMSIDEMEDLWEEVKKQ